jgi:hypothetical protein
MHARLESLTDLAFLCIALHFDLEWTPAACCVRFLLVRGDEMPRR